MYSKTLSNHECVNMNAMLSKDSDAMNQMTLYDGFE
jgi:hypothetical protein